MSSEQRNDKRVTGILTPVSEEEHRIFDKVIREYHHDFFSRYIRRIIIEEYNDLVKKGLIER